MQVAAVVRNLRSFTAFDLVPSEAEVASNGLVHFAKVVDVANSDVLEEPHLNFLD